jgi:hypothetical protein
MECAGHAIMNAQINTANTARKPDIKPTNRIWLGGVVARTLFLIILAVVTARVASPQIETFRSAFETPGDLIRVLLGFAVCFWLVINIFRLPKDAGAYHTWSYLGLGLVPLEVLCAVVVW